MAIGLLLVVAVFAIALLMAGGGFLIGYTVGRSAARRESQRGFPVLPLDESAAPK